MRGLKPERRLPEPRTDSGITRLSRVGKCFKAGAIVLAVAVALASIAWQLLTRDRNAGHPRLVPVRPVSSAYRSRTERASDITAAATQIDPHAITHNAIGLGCATASVPTAALLCADPIDLASSGLRVPAHPRKTATVAVTIAVETCALDARCTAPDQAAPLWRPAPILTTASSAPAVPRGECVQAEPNLTATAAIVTAPALANLTSSWRTPTCATSQSGGLSASGRTPAPSSRDTLGSPIGMTPVSNPASSIAVPSAPTVSTSPAKPGTGPTPILPSGGTAATLPTAPPAPTPPDNTTPKPAPEPESSTPSPYTQPYETPPR